MRDSPPPKAGLSAELWVIIALLVVVRLLAMVIIPLRDTTEARYGEIARKMVETKDWITPWFDYGVPFWGKPPLSTWTMALSFEVFGINEFSSRLPAFLLFGISLWLIAIMMAGRYPSGVRLLAILIFSSMGLSYLVSGTAMTDMALLVSVWAAQVFFWRMVIDTQTRWGYLFFAALGFALLAKGLAALVLATLPIFIWLLINRSWLVLKKLPWISGSALMLAIALPWYIAAEMKTPGFLNYFIIGEHINRYLEPGWKGDRYGFAHNEIRGKIWYYFFMGALPWSLAALVTGWHVLKRWKLSEVRFHLSIPKSPSYVLYLACLTLVPLIFFTPARNIILSYALTALPSTAIIMALLWAPKAFTRGQIRPLVARAVAIAPIIMIIIMILFSSDFLKKGNIYHALSIYHQRVEQGATSPFVYIGRRLYATEFYTGGKAIRFDNLSSFLREQKTYPDAILALSNDQVSEADNKDISQLQMIGETSFYKVYQFKGEI